MKQYWDLLVNNFNQLTTRERGLIIGLSAFLLLFFIYLPISTQFTHLTRNQAQVAQLKSQNQAANQLINDYQQRLKLDPNEDYRRQLAKIEKQLSQVDNQFAVHNIIPAKYMPTLLSQLLTKAKGIKLLAFDSIPPEPLVQVGDKQKMNLYSHGVRLSIEGSYFDVLNFTKAVENMKDKLYWKYLDYQVSKYPKANVELEFYTLSVNKDFISVAK